MPSMGHSTEDDLHTKKMDIRSLSPSHHHSQNMHHIHKVGVPPKQNLFKEFKDNVKETFFSDEPLRPFKDQTKSRKLLLGIETFFPIVGWVRSYNLSKLRGDIIAGLTIASLCIPQVNFLPKRYRNANKKEEIETETQKDLTHLHCSNNLFDS